MIRVVLDTNVVVSALISPFGNPAQVLLAALDGRIVPCFSNDVLAEYSEVLARPKFAIPARTVTRLIASLRAQGVLCAPRQKSPGLPDSDDEIFLACALAANAEYIVTGNQRHFPAKACHPIRTVTARELLDVLQ